MMVRSMSSNTRPDTLMQDRTLQAYRFLLQRTAGPYIGVKMRRTPIEHILSALPPLATEERTFGIGSSVPIADSYTAAKNSLSGTARPSIRAIATRQKAR